MSKYAEINLRSKMICHQLPSMDGYKVVPPIFPDAGHHQQVNEMLLKKNVLRSDMYESQNYLEERASQLPKTPAAYTNRAKESPISVHDAISVGAFSAIRSPKINQPKKALKGRRKSDIGGARRTAERRPTILDTGLQVS